MSLEILETQDSFEVVTDIDGRFISRNLPEMWQAWIKISDPQLFYKEDVKKIKIRINK